ncbi:MAG: FAD-dependent oxidoreductase [Alphaproteobacteria bacterium]
MIRLLLKAQALQGEATPPAAAPGITRRSFVKGLVSVGAAGIVSQAFPFTAKALAAAGGIQPRIAVIGGGLAGLNAAYRLKQAGFSSKIYEASNRLGGRVISRAGLVGDDLMTDLGGELINSDHRDMLKLASKLKIPLFNKIRDAKRQKCPEECYYFDGRLRSEQEIASDLLGLAVRLATDAAFLDRDFKKYGPVMDAMSVEDYLDMHADKIHAPYIRTLIRSVIHTEYGVDPVDSSALQLIYSLPKADGKHADLLGKSDEMYTVMGGSEAIIHALKKNLDGQISFQKEVRAIRAKDDGYRLEFSEGEPVESDYVVVALPFTVLQDVSLDAPVPDKLQKFIQTAKLGSNEKLLAGFNHKTWRREKIFSMGFWNDHGFDQVWDATQRQPEQKSGVLNFFMGGNRVTAAATGGVLACGENFVGRLDQIAPGAKADANGQYFMTNWTEGRLTRGAYSSYRPGQLTEFREYFWVESDHPEQRQAVHAGNLIFAGEQLSDEHFGYMNGAAQTGRLAADFIMRSLIKSRKTGN